MEVSHSNKQNPNSSSSSSVRVLVRSQSSSSTSNAHHVPSSSSDPLPYLPSNGVVVVGFIGGTPTVTNHLVNRIVDANVFGSGHSDTSLFTDNEELRGWFERRRISYYHDEEKGILFLQFSSSSCFGFGSAVEEEELEFGDLQGMLVMFSVCHVIIYVQDGIRFDTQLLKKFRILQAAKNGLAPFVRSQIATGLPPSSRPPSSRSATSTSNTSSPAKNRSILSRTGTSVSLISGLSSHASLFPGYCTPVTMFVFVEDFSNTPNPGSNVGDNQSIVEGFTRPSLPSKVSGPVVVLARPVSKSEGGFKKTLQTSLESQIRFLIKKCRTVSSSAPLFSLDSSRAVVLLDRSANQVAEPLEFATRLVEDVLNGKATSDSLLLESHSQYAIKEDMVEVKDFIHRQSGILRGKGSLVGNSSSGVGMVALAAAAAAASASIRSAKALAMPELPSLEAWLYSTRLILNGILSAKGGSLDEIGISKRKPQPRSNIPLPPEVVASKVSEPLDIAASWLGSSKGINTKFSTMWCERNLPAARAAYLKDLPPCYPSSTHEVNLEKALRAFHSMVKGPAVQQYAKKLEDECTAVWKSGRQLCGAISLTGKPCVHRIHDIPSSKAVSGSEAKPHCSGYVFLHACACGRSRRLRLDPFDFESASDCSEDCDKLLPSAQLPNLADSWSLIRVGGAKYYEPSKGLLQSGFCVTHKFLLKWDSIVESQKGENGPTLGSLIQSSTEPKFEPGASTDTPSEVEPKRKPSETEMVPNEKSISFGKGLPNVTMRKPFAEVVAGSAARNSEFPPLQLKKQPSSILNMSSERQSKTDNHHRGSQKPEETLIAPGSNGMNTDNISSSNGDLYPRLGSYMVPSHHKPGRRNPSFMNVAVYVGFEHECPRGHRFILNPDHLKDLGKFYQSPEEPHALLSGDGSDHRPANPPKLNGNGRRRKPFKKERNSADKSKEQGGTGLDDGASKLQVHDLGILDRIRVDDNKQAISMLNRNLPLYMNCPHCRNSKNNQEPPKAKFAGTVSQLQRIILVTPPFPTVLTTCPVVQFEASCLPQSMSPRHEQKLQFSLGREVVLPPESFLALRLPFVYGVKSEEGTQYSLKPFEHQPEATAWIVIGTALKIVSKGNNADQ